jgi:hypothetical protein
MLGCFASGPEEVKTRIKKGRPIPVGLVFDRRRRWSPACAASIFAPAKGIPKYQPLKTVKANHGEESQA